MATLELALLMLTTVIFSSVLDQIIPRISLPLIQIALGAAVGLLAQERITIALDPDLFLVLFIAPLLFYEAREANNLDLWKNRRTMLSYAIGLVVAIVLAIGFTVNWFIPSIPLAAAFALGAALGPTDPIAVASISQSADIPHRQQTTLKGESLLNDASGIVSFQFAIAAVVTGTFSLFEAVSEFLVEFFGAILVGVILGYLLVKFAEKMRDMGLENTTFHVLLEVLTPLIAYLIGEELGVSGVILVVACGITMSLLPRDFGPSSARLRIVSNSVWQVITFTLNGIVFVMLGTQLPQSFGDLWLEDGISNFDLVFYILLITLIMHGVRFLWTLVSDAWTFSKADERVGVAKRLRSAAVMTLAGSKGAITLAIMFTIPNWISTGTTSGDFPQRDLLIFLASGVILASLLLATFVVPLLAPRKSEGASETREADIEAKADILRRVVEELTARQTPKNRRTLGKVISQYNDRIERVKDAGDLENPSDYALRIKALEWEQEYVLQLIEDDEVPPVEGYQYVSRSARVVAMIKGNREWLARVMRLLRRRRLFLRKLWNRLRKRSPEAGVDESKLAMREIQEKATVHAIGKLQDLMADPDSDVPTEQVSRLLGEYQRTLSLLRGRGPSVTRMARNAEIDADAARMAMRCELDQIQNAYEEGRISRAGAKQMRENVYLMYIDVEDYM